MNTTKHGAVVWMGWVAAVLITRVAPAQETPVKVSTPVAPGLAVVWADTPWQPLTADMKPPANPAMSIKLAAARGGIANGIVVVSGASGPVSAKAEALKGPGGTVPVRLRYATRKRDLGPAVDSEIAGRKLDAGFDLGRTTLLDALSDNPVGDEPIQPVWLTVDVPATAQPGEYQGTIVIEGKAVSVSLSVANFQVPPLGQRCLYANVHQSPDTVAFRYGTAPWSDRHFQLLEPSLALAGRIGANIMYVPVIGRTYFGQRNGLVVFTRKGEELVPDFSYLERYLDLWIKQVGKPRLVVLNVWDTCQSRDFFIQRHYLARMKQFSLDPNIVELTVRGDSGKFEQVSTPAYDKNQKLWKAVVEGVQECTAKVGLAKHQVLLGQCTDDQPTKETVECFKAIDPESRWTAWTHGYGYAGGSQGMCGTNGGQMGLMAYPDIRTNPLRGPGRCVPILPGPDTVIVLDAMRMYLMGWERGGQSGLRWRLTPDLSADWREHGYGPVGLDLWPLPPLVPTAEEKANRKFRQGGMWSLKLDYGPNLDRGQPGACTVAGPQGALSTVRLEALAEGACEAEARLCIELAIAAKKMDAATAKPIMVARYKPFEKIAPADRSGRANTICDVSGDTPVPSDWSDSLAALYDLAANAQRAMGNSHQ